jgi:hypothetical protein
MSVDTNTSYTELPSAGHLENEPPISTRGPRAQSPARFLERLPETRYETHDAAEVCILEPDLSRVAATVLDVSRSGLRIRVKKPVGKNIRLEIFLPNRAIIFGETSYCRAVSGGYDIGIAIEDVYYAQPVSERHIEDDQMDLYAADKGLTVLEVIHIKNHLTACLTCRRRLAEIEAILRPFRQRPS